MAAYTSADRVAEHLGQTFTGAQNAQVEAVLPAVEAFINGRTGRTWDTVAAITAEQHGLSGRLLWLSHVPVTSIQSLTVRDRAPGSTPTTLVAATDYELLHAPTGLVSVRDGYAGWLATVAYTPAVPLDARIERAATLLAAAWVRPAVEGVSGDIKQYSVGQELSVTFRDPATGSIRGVPDDVVALLDQCARPAPVFA